MNIKKIIGKAQKNKKEEFSPTCASIQKLCKKTSCICFDQICNRILRDYEKDEKLGDFIRIESTNGFDILLDEDGIMMFLDILEGYFDRKHLLDLYKYLRELNKLQRTEYQFAHIFDHLDTSELRKVLVDYENRIVEPKDETARQMVIDKARADLKKRKRVIYISDFKKIEGAI
jgi:hypothetical protein